MKAATTALKAEYGTHYRYGPIHKVIYQAGGGSGDYIYEAWLPDGCSQIFRLYVYSGLKYYGSATLRCKIWYSYSM